MSKLLEFVQDSAAGPLCFAERIQKNFEVKIHG
jgi:hypothetical protein